MAVLNKTKPFKIAVLGGGTGSFTLLNGFKNYNFILSAIVNMSDDGGSTGVLRDELGVLPPGDVRRCLVALSESPKIRELFEYRFENGRLEGHAFGNLLLAALEKMTGSYSEAVETASDILKIRGTVIPATLNNIRLVMRWPDKNFEFSGEKRIDVEDFPFDPRQAELKLVPLATANPHAMKAIEEADAVILAPGDLYTSIGPILVIDGVRKSLKITKATIVYVCNLVTKKGQTDGFDIIDHATEIERFIGIRKLDVVLYNTGKPEKGLLERYAKAGEYWISSSSAKLSKASFKAVGGDFIAREFETTQIRNDPLAGHRTFIRHNADNVAEVLLSLLSHT